MGEPRPDRRAYELAKRVLDCCLAAALLVVLSPLLAIAAVTVRATSPGPVLFRQERVGRHREPFTMLKFRTMRTDADDRVHREYVVRLMTEDRPPTGGLDGVYKLVGDPRVTGVGAVLRRTSLDELPQLLNVLQGHMALVGPRPVLAWETELYQPRHMTRFEVPPGMTGLWQVSGRNKLKRAEALDLDVVYVHRRSMRLDLSILARTLPATVTGGGAR
jgi:lipopolysaccharide/colanic/teichoic acid biosynthesis glycosyltransferase